IVLTFSRPQTTGAVTRGAARLFTALGYAPLLEVTLPNGRRADIMALGPRGEMAIIEVKSSLEDFRVDRKWGEYLPFCDLFFLGARLARMRCRVRRCMFSRRAVSETLWPHSS